MPIAPEVKVKREDVRLRIDSAVLLDAYAYAKFLNDSSIHHVVTAALRAAMRNDRKFQEWLAKHPEERKAPQTTRTGEAQPAVAAAGA